jgi:hypothetical protein
MPTCASVGILSKLLCSLFLCQYLHMWASSTKGQSYMSHQISHRPSFRIAGINIVNLMYRLVGPGVCVCVCTCGHKCICLHVHVFTLFVEILLLVWNTDSSLLKVAWQELTTMGIQAQTCVLHHPQTPQKCEVLAGIWQSSPLQLVRLLLSYMLNGLNSLSRR